MILAHLGARRKPSLDFYITRLEEQQNWHGQDVEIVKLAQRSAPNTQLAAIFHLLHSCLLA